MSLGQMRGGIPRVFRGTIQIAGRKWTLPFYTNNVIFRVVAGAANGCRMFFTEQDFNDDVNYVEVAPPGANETSGEWCGPVEADNLWFKGAGGPSDIEATVFQRRG